MSREIMSEYARFVVEGDSQDPTVTLWLSEPVVTAHGEIHYHSQPLSDLKRQMHVMGGPGNVDEMIDAAIKFADEWVRQKAAQPVAALA